MMPSPNGTTPQQPDSSMRPIVRTIAFVGADPDTQELLAEAVARRGWQAISFESAEQYWLSPDAARCDCLIIDIDLPGRGSAEFQERLRFAGRHAPVIVISATASLPRAVRAMENGAVRVLEKPCRAADLIRAVDSALEVGASQKALRKWRAAIIDRMVALTDDERRVMELMVADAPNKTIASRLEVSPRTVDRMRRSVLEKMEADSAPQLAMLVAELLEEARSRC